MRAPPGRRGSALHLPPLPGARELWAPRPLLFVTARLPVCGRRPRLTSRAGKPPKAASFSETLPLGPSSCLLLPRGPARGGSRGKREPWAGVAAGRQGGRRTLEGAARLSRPPSCWRLLRPPRGTAGDLSRHPESAVSLSRRARSSSLPLSSGSNWKEPSALLSSEHCPGVQKAKFLHLLKPALPSSHHLPATSCRWSSGLNGREGLKG